MYADLTIKEEILEQIWTEITNCSTRIKIRESVEWQSKHVKRPMFILSSAYLTQRLKPIDDNQARRTCSYWHRGKSCSRLLAISVPTVLSSSYEAGSLHRVSLIGWKWRSVDDHCWEELVWQIEPNTHRQKGLIGQENIEECRFWRLQRNCRYIKRDSVIHGRSRFRLNLFQKGTLKRGGSVRNEAGS